MKGVNFQFTATNKAAPAMQSFQNGLKGVSNQMRSATAANQSFMRGMNDNRRAVQQMGFQIADFSVQVAGGQNKILAFAQQGGQILQFFGAFGAVAGAALAVFAAWAMATGAFTDQAESLSDAMKKLDTASKAYADAARLSLTSMRELEAQFGRNAQAVRELYDAQLKIARMDMIKSQDAVVSSLRQQVVEVGRLTQVMALPFQNAPMVQRDIVNLTASIKTNLNLTVKEAMGLQTALDNVSKAMGPDETFAAARALQTALLAAADASGKLPPELEAAYRASVDLQQSAIAAGLAIGEASDAGKILNDTNMSDGLADALSVAQQLALATREALFPKVQGRGDPRQFVEDPYWKDKYLPSPEKMNFPKTKKPGGAGGGGKEDPLAELQKQLTLESAILGKTEAQQRIIRALGPDWQKYGDVAITGLTGQIDAIEAFNQKMADQQSIANTIKSSMEDAFMGIVSGTMKAKDAFKSMAASVISELFRIMVVQKLVNSILGVFNLSGTGAVAAPITVPSANGGGYTGYGARSGGVDGKGGFLSVLHPDETILDHTKGQGAGGVVVNQTISFGSGVTRAEVQSMIPKIVDATKAAVLDARKRGGSYGSAFA